MRRDLTFYFEKDINTVFKSIVQACSKRFVKDVRQELPHTISMTLGFSFRYNMNGGALTIHLMPYGKGTAVDYRYSVVQATGARCGAHAKALNETVVSILGVKATDVDIGIDQFLNFKNNQVCGVQSTVTNSENEDNFEKLQKLKLLYDNGVITKEEFETKKAELLKQI